MHGLGVDMSGGLDAQQYVDMTSHGHAQHMDLHAEGEGWECSPIHHGGQHDEGEWWHHQQQHQHHAGGQGYEDVIVSAGPTPVLDEGGMGGWDGEWEGSEGLALTPVEGAGLGHVPSHVPAHAQGMMMPAGGIGMESRMEFMAYA